MSERGAENFDERSSGMTQASRRNTCAALAFDVSFASGQTYDTSGMPSTLRKKNSNREL
jgi:hypothetical protein